MHHKISWICEKDVYIKKILHWVKISRNLILKNVEIRRDDSHLMPRTKTSTQNMLKNRLGLDVFVVRNMFNFSGHIDMQDILR